MKRFYLFLTVLLILPLTLFAQGSKMKDADPMSGTEPFTSLDDAKMSADTVPTVLFFHASWCPSCRAAKKELDTRSSELKDVSVLLVDYDKANDLKMKYNVTYQHTFVLIDDMGEKVSMWNGGDVDEILQAVEKEMM